MSKQKTQQPIEPQETQQQEQQQEPVKDAHFVYIDGIARITHEANRAYCLMHGDTSHQPWDEAPEALRASVRDGVRALLEGRVSTPEQSHENWLRYKEAEGYRYGEVKDVEAKTHPCFLPYAELPVEQRRKDHIFRAIVGTFLGGAL